MHPTLLPEGRGRASIPGRARESTKDWGYAFRLDEGVDTGPILDQYISLFRLKKMQLISTT